MTGQNPIAGQDSVEFVSEFLLTSDNGQAVELDSLRTIVDFDEGSVTVQGQLLHFSPLVESLLQDRTKASGRFSLIGFPDEVIASPDIFSTRLVAQVDQEAEGEEPFMVTKVLIDQSVMFPLFTVSPGEGVTEFPAEDILIAELDYRCTRVGMGELVIIGAFIDEITRQGELVPTAALNFGVSKSINCVEEMPATVNLQIALDGDGSGSVSSNPAGIECPVDCGEEYNEATDVTLTATSDKGSEFVTWSGDIFEDNAPQDSVITIPMDQARSITATFELEQTNNGFLQRGLFTLPALTNPETIVVLGGPEQAFANFPSGSVPALVQGAEGFVVIDLINGEVLLDFTGLPNNGSVGVRTPLGALAVTRPDPGPNTLSFIGSFAQDNNNTEFGFNFFRYDIQDQSFIKGPVSPSPSTIDGFSIGGKVISDEIVAVREGGFGITFFKYSEISNQYQFEPSSEARISARYGFEQAVTAYGEFAEGPLVVVNLIGDLYFDPRNKLIPSVRIGNVGEKIIKIRCEIPICVTTDESGDALRIIRWDGLNQPEIIGNPLQVGDGPVDPDLYKLPNGNILIGATGFNDNTIPLLEVDPVGAFISGQVYNAPVGLVKPGHFHFINNPNDPTNPFVGITGFGSDNYYIQDTIEIRKLTVNAGVRPIE